MEKELARDEEMRVTEWMPGCMVPAADRGTGDIGYGSQEKERVRGRNQKKGLN